jgi:hypothetical protein
LPVLANILNNHRTIETSILRNAFHRNQQSLANCYSHRSVSIIAIHLEIIKGSNCIQERHTPPPGTIPSSTAARWQKERLPHEFLFFQFGLSGCANPNDGNPTGEFGKTFLQFFAIVIAGGLVDLDTDLINTTLDST